MRRLLLSPAVVIAAGTVWVYLVAAQYSRGYLGHFDAKLSWFDPSLFRLLAFAYPGLIGGAVFLAVLGAMAFAATQRRIYFVPALIVYLALVVAASYFLGWKASNASGSTTGTVVRALSLATWGAAPFVWRWQFMREKMREAALASEIRDGVDALELVRLYLKFNSEGDVTDSINKVEEAIAIAKAHLAAAPAPDFGAWLGVAWLALYLFPFASGHVGTMIAVRDEALIRSHLRESTGEQVVFTDGHAALIYSTDNGDSDRRYVIGLSGLEMDVIPLHFHRSRR